MMMMMGEKPWLFLLHLLLVFVVVLLVFMKPVVASSAFNSARVPVSCIEKEREALVLFKEGLVDDYGILSSWGSEDGNKNCCRWWGIKCSNQTGHVIMLDLHDASFGRTPLRGKISPSLLELQHLNYLDLSNNDFGGSHIPMFIGSLTKLRHLHLSDANFGGTVPYQLGNLTNLQHLGLGSNSIYDLNVENLEWLSHLSLLTYLDMNFVNLSKAIDWLQAIHMLPSLSELHLSYCELSNVVPPSSLSFVNSSTSLAFLELSYNHLSSSIFHSLFNFSGSLVHVYLTSNHLQGSIPDAFHNKSLAHLFLDYNELEGRLPKSFGNLCTLQALDLSRNNFSEELSKFVQDLSGCAEKSLEVLDLAGSQFSGSLPDMKRFSSLRYLSLARNHLNGTIPESIGQLSKLEVLDVSYNSLEGNICESHLSNLPELKSLGLSIKSLSFDLSSHWVPPFQLDEITLRACKLGPYFPKWLQNQKQISLIDISNTGISESIPEWFWDLSPRLYHLNLSCNKINGKLPNLSLKFSRLLSLDLSSNHLDGPIPLLASNLVSLDLSQNRFSGPISSLCAITGGLLVSVDLSNNLLSGELPDCWMQFRKLGILNLGNNNLCGKIPSSIGSLTQIETLHIRNNRFFGELPSSLKNCTQLVLLDMGENHFSGKIPAWIGKSLSLLIVLSLPSNEFYGSIPLDLCHLENIQILDLSRNNISGTIPHCLKNFTAMSQKESLGGTLSLTYYRNFPSVNDNYVDSVVVVWKRLQQEYGSKLRLVKIIDLSANKLAGKIPEEIASLIELVALNLSRNNLSGEITSKIGQLKMLNFLDLSQNQLFGEIPASLSNLDSLGVLDLSNNRLSGKIPISPHLQTFDASSYMGNRDLCGAPLPNKCPGDETTQNPQVTDGSEDANIREKEDGLITRGFYISMALGFIIGFWGVCSSLFFIRSWRYAYFHFLNNVTDWLYVKTAVHMARIKRRHGG